MELRLMKPELCERQPYRYKKCSDTICIRVKALCPCDDGRSYRCSDGKCISVGYHCDGVQHCSRGEDELACPGSRVSLSTTTVSEGLTVSTVALIVSICVFVCVIAAFILCMVLMRRRKYNTSTESHSGAASQIICENKEDIEQQEPLKADYSSQDPYSSGGRYENVFMKSKPTTNVHYKQRYIPDKERKQLTQMCHEPMIENDIQSECTFKPITPETTGDNNQRRENKYTNKITIKNSVQCFDENSSSPTLGNYMFKPRLKHIEALTNMVDIQDIATNRVLNSYKHCSGNVTLPVTLNVGPDDFATELLCASTPRQPVKHLVRQTANLESF